MRNCDVTSLNSALVPICNLGLGRHCSCRATFFPNVRVVKKVPIVVATFDVRVTCLGFGGLARVVVLT